MSPRLLPLAGAAIAACFAASFPAFASAEVVDRSEFSTTTRSSSGELTTRAASVPINFNDGGQWRSVDTSLESAGGGVVVAAAVDGSVEIPSTAGGRVAVAHDGREVTLKLVGASGGSRVVTDSTAQFTGVLPGVSASYTATPRGVKEIVKLGSSADRVLEYDLRGPDAWSAVLAGDDIVLKDSGGTIRFRVSAPIAWDSATDKAYTNDLALTVSKVCPMGAGP